MVDNKQVNLRVPPSDRAVLAKIARRMREDKNFAHRVARFLEEDYSGDIGGLLAQRIERLERQVAELMEARASGDELERTQPNTEASKHSLFEFRDEPTRPWTMGSGRSRRLTYEGQEELRRLLAEGRTDVQIAARLGVKPYSVSQQRRKVEQEG